jgi:hypothetical protein
MGYTDQEEGFCAEYYKSDTDVIITSGAPQMDIISAEVREKSVIMTIVLYS